MRSMFSLAVAAAGAILFLGCGSTEDDSQVTTTTSPAATLAASPTVTDTPSPAPATATVTPTDADAWWKDAFNLDSERPRFDQIVNGLGVGPTVDAPSHSICDKVEPEHLSAQDASGSPLEVAPTYLPAGVTALRDHAVRCGPLFASVLVEYNVSTIPGANDQAIPVRAGGSFSILRTRGEGDSYPLFGASERIEANDIKGRTGVLIRPVTPDGLDIGIGSAAIIIKEPFGFTAIQGTGLPTAEFIRIAESLSAG